MAATSALDTAELPMPDDGESLANSLWIGHIDKYSKGIWAKAFIYPPNLWYPSLKAEVRLNIQYKNQMFSLLELC